MFLVPSLPRCWPQPACLETLAMKGPARRASQTRWKLALPQMEPEVGLLLQEFFLSERLECSRDKRFWKKDRSPITYVTTTL